MANTSIPQTQNREWGFFGTISHYADPERAWDIALAFIAGITGCSADATRAFLDIFHGHPPNCTSSMTAGMVPSATIPIAFGR
jgi:hypothetical protein